MAMTRPRSKQEVEKCKDCLGRGWAGPSDHPDGQPVCMACNGSGQDEGPWSVVYEKCRICGYKAMGVIPAKADEFALECYSCGSMSSESISKEEWES